MFEDRNYGPHRRWNFYWCIKTDLSKETGEIYAWADEVRIDQGGCLVLVYHHQDKREQVNLAFAPGSWRGIYAASVIDGTMVAVQDWKGEIVD